MAEKQFKKGEVIFREGDNGDTLFQINEGIVGIYASYGEEDQQLLTELGKGRIFGEMAVIESYPRSATAVAIDDVKAEEIQAGSFTEYFKTQPDKVIEVMKSLCGRIRSLSAEYADVSKTIKDLHLSMDENTDRSESLIEKIRKFASVYKRNKNAEKISAETKRKLEQKDHAGGFTSKVETYPEGTVIFRDGETGDCMYDIHMGSVGIYKDYGTPKQRLLTELNVNQFFGEMGMLERSKRSGTAVALEDGTTIEMISENDLEGLFEKNPMKVEMLLSYLSHRLRVLTGEYMSACGILFRLSDAEDKGQAVSEEVKTEVREYDAIYVNL